MSVKSILPALFLSGWLCFAQSPVEKVSLLPPFVEGEVANYEKVVSLFEAYRAFVDQSPCFQNYSDLLTLLDQSNCGDPETGLLVLQGCLRRNGLPVLLVTAQINKTGIVFLVDGEQRFSSESALFGYLQQKYCAETPEQVVAAEPAESEATGDYDAVLLSHQTGRLEDGFRVRIEVKAQEIVLTYALEGDEVVIGLDRLIDLQPGPPVALVTAEEVFYLQFKDPNSTVLEEMQRVAK